MNLTLFEVESIGGAIFIINHHSEPHDSVDIIRSDIKQLHNCVDSGCVDLCCVVKRGTQIELKEGNFLSTPQQRTHPGSSTTVQESSKVGQLT